MKTCPRCMVDKEETEFAISNRTGKVCGVCQPCYEQHYAHLSKSSDYHKDKQRKERNAHKKDKIARGRHFLFEILKSASCMDCGYSNWIALEFDHRDPEQKHDAVTRMVNDGTTLERIKQEVAKCDIVCANCHAIRTANSSGSWRVTLPLNCPRLPEFRHAVLSSPSGTQDR